MRVLSIRFWHHFSYLVISTALLGLGASGTLLTLIRRFAAPRRRGVLVACALLLAVSIPLAVRAAELVGLDAQFLAWDLRGQIGRLVQIELIYLVPLLLAGLAVGTALLDDPQRIGGHYAANLIGAGAGALAGVLLLENLSLPATVTVLAAGGWAGALLTLPWRRPAAVVAAVAVAAALAAVHLLMPWTPAMSDQKSLVQYKLMPGTRTVARAEGAAGRVEAVAGPAVHYAPGLSLNCPKPIPPQAVLTVDGDPAGAVFGAEKPADYAFLDWTTLAAPYSVLKKPAVLILGAGGGSDIGLALYRRSRRVVAVEMNRQVVELMDGPLRDRGGGVYRWPKVELVNAEARGVLARRAERFDLIQLPPSDPFGASAAGVCAGQESYLYTVEAFESMLRRLTPEGVICVTRWARTPPRDGLRVLALAEQAVRGLGKSPYQHIVMVRNWATVSVMLFQSPLMPRRLDALEAFCTRRNLDLCFMPGLTAEKVNRFHQLAYPYYHEGAAALVGPAHFTFLSRYLFDVRPTTDDRPYFHHFFRWRAWPVLRKQLGGLSRAYLELGYVLLVATLAQSVPVAAVLILLPLLARGRVLRRSAGKARAFGYFLLIGLGFMFLEMSFLQRLTLYLAQPIYSAAVVIGAFLVFGGIGSHLSGRWRQPPESVIRRAGVVVVGIAVLYVVGLRGLLAVGQSWPVTSRAALAVGLIAPLAVAMGHMFPAALRKLGASEPALVPWCWAVNGFASVVATVGATLLAMEMGFTVVAAAGAGAYLLAIAACTEAPPVAEEEAQKGRKAAPTR